ncbi:hypothetical protein BDB00DRAFT_866541 [Zychaea mexicana]|uniref:uncharacterized protein n=1 Tax=Zychaea mexicana TaxID=64656 RepID=UPI0022FE028F|nr:uncharacterized protein BDB00DRAFT_866541 [Zychaea mexicana]KAI9499681.1 hypothetical protein BDB00DRAFT_866541 [Zychaea mexicana]
MTNSTNSESNNADEVALSQINDHISLIYGANNLVNFTFDADPGEEIAAVNPLLSDEEIVGAVHNERITDDDVVDKGNEDANMTVSSEPVTPVYSTAVGRSLSLSGNGAINHNMGSQAYFHGGTQPAISERSLEPSPLPPPSVTAGMTGAAGADGSAVATHNNKNNRLSKPGQQQQQQEQYDPNRRNPHASWMSQASTIEPFCTAATYNYVTQPYQLPVATSPVERPPTTIIRESTYNNLHAPIFHFSVPPDDNAVLADWCKVLVESS